MAQAPLNERGGKAAAVQVKMPDETLARVIALAVRTGRGKSAMTRQLVRLGLDVLELAETSPGDSGAPA